MQQALEPLGINVKIRTIDVNQLFTTQGKGDYQMSIDYWTMDIPDPDENTQFFLNGEGDGNCYFTRYNNPTMNKMVTDAAKEFDPAKREQLYKQIQQLARVGPAPAVPLLLALPLRVLHQGAGLLRHASGQHAPRGRMAEQVGSGPSVRRRAGS